MGTACSTVRNSWKRWELCAEALQACSVAGGWWLVSQLGRSCVEGGRGMFRIAGPRSGGNSGCRLRAQTAWPHGMAEMGLGSHKSCLRSQCVDIGW